MLTLAALVRLRTLGGEPTDQLAARRDTILARLGVMSVLEPRSRSSGKRRLGSRLGERRYPPTLM